MITQTRTNPIRFTFAAAAVVASTLCAPAYAGDAVRAATGEPVGHAIAEQGNQALQQIREDMRRSLKEAMPPPTDARQHSAQPLPALAPRQVAA
jgi:hypothetical protein